MIDLMILSQNKKRVKSFFENLSVSFAAVWVVSYLLTENTGIIQRRHKAYIVRIKKAPNGCFF